MAKLLALLDIVPAWLWAAAVVVLISACAALQYDRQALRAEAQAVRADLLAVQLASARALLDEAAASRARQALLTKTVVETQDALTQTRTAAAGLAADLAGRLQQSARPVSCWRATPAAGSASVASRGDEQRDPGLPAVAAGDFVVLDAAARAELARFAVSAAETGQTLSACRALLRAAWRMD